MGRKDAVPPQSDAESHSVRPQEGKRMKWGKRNSKRDNVRERETERESMLVQELLMPHHCAAPSSREKSEQARLDLINPHL